jgi:hypothetical protein
MRGGCVRWAGSSRAWLLRGAMGGGSGALLNTLLRERVVVTRCLHAVEVMRSRNEHITARFASRFHRGARKDRKTETNSYGSVVRVSLPDDLFTIYVRSDLLTFCHFFGKGRGVVGPYSGTANRYQATPMHNPLFSFLLNIHALSGSLPCA